MTTAQYAFRSLKKTGLVSGPPDWISLEAPSLEDTAVRSCKYSPDGRYIATASSNGVQILNPTTGALLTTIPLKAVLDIAFSPLGTQIQTWERLQKTEDGEPGHKNLKIWSTETGEEVAGFSQKSLEGWSLHYTHDESFAVRLIPSTVHIFDPKKFEEGTVGKLRVEGVSDAVVSGNTTGEILVGLFIGEKKGSPASVKIYSLPSLLASTAELEAKPLHTKTFFKSDKITMKFNSSGTSLLFLTQTEVDKTGKSYYGETNLYLLGKGVDGRVELDKDGGIHDFAWSPNGNEFTVTYGYMPAKTVIFSSTLKILHSFGTAPRNFIAYNPQGRLLCIAGFGNLAGKLDIWDRKTLKKICEIDAPNTSHCEWSPDGRFLINATLSPRLRVDNGVRVVHYTGVLVHVQSVEELYQTTWRPQDADLFPFTGPVEAPPTASSSVSTSTPVKVAAPAGAYRPPHARGTLTPISYKREDEGGAAYNPSSTSSLSNGGRSNSPTFGTKNRRGIPGMAPPTTGDGDEGGKKKKKDGNGNGKNGNKRNGNGNAFEEVVIAPTPVVVVVEEKVPELLSSEDKKRRALMKKLTAIDALKIKKMHGEKLELTQHKKLESEAELRAELQALDLGVK